MPICKENNIKPGDLLFSKTSGSFYREIRKLANNHYDHISLVLSGTKILQINPLKIRLLSLFFFMKPNRSIQILRPLLTIARKKELVLKAKALLGQLYSIASICKHVLKYNFHIFFVVMNMFEKY